MDGANGVLGVINATVLTMDPRVPACEAVLLAEGRIAARGTSDEIGALCRDRGGQVVNLAGRTVVPGFHDCHVHMMGTGLNSTGIDMYECTSVADVLEKVREAAGKYPEERWVFGNRLDESRLREKRPPTAAELDGVAPRHPVYIIDRGWHYTLVNGVAFKLLDLSESVPGVRLGPDGRFTGRLHEDANGRAKRTFFEKQDRTQREDALRFTAKTAARAGVTTLHAVEGGELFSDTDIPVILDAQRWLPVRVVLYWSTEDMEKVRAAGLPRMGGDLVLDGSIGSRTAAFSDPYADDPATRGSLYYPDARVEALIETAHLADVQIAFHMIGERAIGQGLDCFERVLARHPKADHRHRLEHFGFPRPGDVERAARAGLVISTQPAFTYLRGGPGSVYNIRLGDARDRRAYPLRGLLDAGLVVGGGSDSDVTPIDPILGIHAAVNPPYAEHAVTPQEALRMFTIEAARTAFEERQKGSIEEGKLADLTVLSQNPLAVAPAALKDIQVIMTIKGGEITYQKAA